jgi:NAD(P)-dependent dehydrogenase (short-subunit alcohol dehydrogenase family)/acyl carrier protein
MPGKDNGDGPDVTPEAVSVAVDGGGQDAATPEGWLQAYQELQFQISNAHANYQRLMAESHMAFLHAAETTAVGLQSLVSGEAGEMPLPPGPAMPAMPPQPAVQPAYPAPPVMSMQAPAPVPVSVPVAAPVAVAVDEEDPAAAMATERPSAEQMKGLLLEVVAEKTGYPTDILDLEMNLESDLGIDSIKRVEILSALQEKAPYIPEVDATELPNLETLGQVLGLMESYLTDEPTDDGASEEPTPGAQAAEPEAQAEEPEAAPKPYPTPEIELEQRDPTDPAAGFNPLEVTDAETSITSSGLIRLEVNEVPAKATGHSILDRVGGDLLAVTDDGAGVARILAGKLRQRGLRVDLVNGEVPDEARGVIFTGGMRPVLDREAAIEVNREAFSAATKVADQMTNQGGVFVTVQATGGDFGLTGGGGVHAWLGGLAGLARSAAKEWRRSLVKAVDMERGSRSSGELAQVLYDELFTGGPELEVGLHEDGTRTTLKDRAAPSRPGPEVLTDRSVVVVTGGARGVTADCVAALARQHRSRILLLGRSELQDEPECCIGITDDAAMKKALLQQAVAKGKAPKPADLGRWAGRVYANREIAVTLANLKTAGSDAMYLPVDIRDRAAVQAALTQARDKWGPITGVIHGAGVLSDKRLKDKTEEQFERVFDTKVEGLRVLLDATSEDPLDLLCLFSSVAARHGNIGQADYAMANEVLNQVALLEAQQRRGTCLVRSINWGPWEGGMVTPVLAEHFLKMGVPLIPKDAGAQFLVDELRGDPGSSVQVLVGGRASGERG